MRTVPEPNPSGKSKREASGIASLLAASATKGGSANRNPANPNTANFCAGERIVSDLPAGVMLDISEDAVAALLEEGGDSLPADAPLSGHAASSPSSRPYAELDAAAREALLLEHLPVVRYIARRIHERLPQHVEMDDLVSAGMVGLLDAFNKFDSGKNVQFRSYAQFRVRGAILDSLRTLDWSPRDLRRKGRAIEEAMHNLTSRLGRTPSENEIATELGMALIDYQQLLGELKGLEIGSLNVEHAEDSGEEELAYIPNSPEEDPLFRCLRGEMQERLATGIEELPEKERLVLTLYYYEEMTMKEIGLTLGVVESRVSQIHSSAVLRLRSRLTQGAKPASAADQQRRPVTRARRPERARAEAWRESALPKKHPVC